MRDGLKQENINFVVNKEQLIHLNERWIFVQFAVKLRFYCSLQTTTRNYINIVIRALKNLFMFFYQTLYVLRLWMNNLKTESNACCVVKRLALEVIYGDSKRYINCLWALVSSKVLTKLWKTFFEFLRYCVFSRLRYSGGLTNVLFNFENTFIKLRNNKQWNRTLNKVSN